MEAAFTKTHLVSGGCGFVGRNMVKRLLSTTEDRILIIDNLSTGLSPLLWLNLPLNKTIGNLQLYGDDARILFLNLDFIDYIRSELQDQSWFYKQYGIDIKNFSDVFHFAAIVGGRAIIEGDPIKVAMDLSIDSHFFYWVSIVKPGRVLYPSSSAAYPTIKQMEGNAMQLTEDDVDFSNILEPDMTYGWAKITGEYLARTISKNTGIHIACIRPFSGYGEDQDLTYPIPAIVNRIVLKEDPVEVWGSGLQGRDFVHIDDVIDCLLLALDRISDGTAVNIGSGRLTTFLEIIEILLHISGHKAPIKKLMDKPVGVHSRYANINKAKVLLGWEPKVDLESGLTRVYNHIHDLTQIPH